MENKKLILAGIGLGIVLAYLLLTNTITSFYNGYFMYEARSVINLVQLLELGSEIGGFFPYWWAYVLGQYLQDLIILGFIRSNLIGSLIDLCVFYVLIMLVVSIIITIVLVIVNQYEVAKFLAGVSIGAVILLVALTVMVAVQISIPTLGIV